MKFSCGCRICWTLPCELTLETIPSLILEIGNHLHQVGDCNSVPRRLTGKATIICNNRSKLYFPPGHLIAALNEWIVTFSFSRAEVGWGERTEGILSLLVTVTLYASYRHAIPLLWMLNFVLLYYRILANYGLGFSSSRNT